MNKNKNNDIQYRRGIVLGLTFAELLILLLFVIMLVLGATIKKGNDVSARQYNEMELSEMTSLASLIKSKNEKNYNEVTNLLKKGEVEKAYQRLTGTLTALIDGSMHQFSENEISEMGSMIALIERKDLAAYQEIKKYLNTGEAEKAYQVMIQSSPILKDLSDQLIVQKNMISDCRAQNKHLVQIKNIGGRGGDFPPCWSENGSIQYIYNIVLTDAGIEVYDIKNLSREEEKKRLPLKGFKIGLPMQPGEFIKAGQPLKKICDENSCRHFVKITDKTSPSSKEHYKKLKNSVENIFYKKDI